MDKRKLLLPAAALALLAAPPAWSQPASGDGDEADEATAGETIFVTVRRRLEAIERTPVAVTRFDAAGIEARSAVDVADLVNTVPNAQFDTTAPLSGSANTASIFIRGIGQTDFVFATDPGVAVYRDGVYIARATGGAFDLIDVERVEVLRGPQGTLFGRNAIGGAISIFTHAPELGTTGGEAEATLGTFRRLDLRGVANVAAGDRVALRVAAGFRREDGEGRRLLDGAELGGSRVFQGRAALRWQAADRLHFDLAVDYEHRDDESPPTSVVPVGGAGALGGPGTLFTGLLYNNLITGPDGLAPCQRPGFPIPFCGLPGIIQLPPLPAGTIPFDARFVTGDPFTTFATGPTGSRFEGWGVTGTAAWEGPVTVRSIIAWRRFDAAFGRDPDSSPLRIIDTTNRLDHEQFSQELQVGGTFGALTFVAGLYHFDERGRDRATAPFIDETFQIINRLGLGCVLLPGATGAPVPIPVNPCPSLFAISFAGDGSRVENRSLAAFGEATLQLNTWLSVSGGLRWTRDRKTIDISGFLIGGRPASPDPVARRIFSRVTPRVIVQAELVPTTMAYVSWSTGFKSGGFNQRYGAPIAAPTAFGPETVQSFEAGLRARLAGGVRLGITGFLADYDDIQAVVFDNGIPRTINAAKGRSRGVEIEASWAAAPGLTLGGSYGFLDTGYTRLDPAIIGSFGTPIVNPLRLDHRFANAPRHSLALSAEYAHDAGTLGRFRLRGDLSHRSSVANDAVNTAELIAGPVTLVNARLTWSPDEASWSAALFVTNLLDEVYIASAVADPAGFGGGEVNFAETRRWGATLEFAF